MLPPPPPPSSSSRLLRQFTDRLWPRITNTYPAYVMLSCHLPFSRCIYYRHSLLPSRRKHKYIYDTKKLVRRRIFHGTKFHFLPSRNISRSPNIHFLFNSNFGFRRIGICFSRERRIFSTVPWSALVTSTHVQGDSVILSLILREREKKGKN